jgi:GNAT superfamily N-acetyltransferase
MRGGYKIREVELNDLDQLFSMLEDLVRYEGIFDRFKMTRRRLEEELFGLNADWHAVVAADLTKQVIGFCLYSFANISRAFNLTPMIQIDDLYVSPDYRRSGIGHELVKELAQIAKEKKITRMNIWWIKDN